ncbi:MAG: NusG domain II-containing protein [Gammaproteobacteria bacterium]|nr:NusG domain II-containing protein [Gammaproteobacteria bacterium]
MFWGETLLDRVVVVLATLSVLSLYPLLWGGQKPASHALIQVQKEEPRSASLQHRQLLHINGKIGISTIEIKDGFARFIDSPCRSKVCIHYGWLKHSGEVIACLPNSVTLSLVGGDSRFDSINF